MSDLDILSDTNGEDELEAKRRRERIERRRKKRNKTLPFGLRSRPAAAVAFILLLIIITAVVFNWNVISPSSISEKADFSDSKKEGASADIAGSSVYEKNFCELSSGLIYISDTSIIQLNHDCEKVYSEKHSFSDPAIRASNDYVIAFGEGSGSFRVIHDKHRVYEGVQGTSITDCDINDQGTYCILSDQTGFLSALSVYDKNNKFIYSYSFSDYYAVTVAISRDGQKVVVGAINSSDGRLVSKIYLLDVTKSDPIKIFTYEDQLVYQTEFISDSAFAVVTDVMTTVIKSDGSREVPYSYSNSMLTAYDMCYGSGVVLALSKSDDGRSCYVVELDEDGHEVSRFATDLKITALAAASDRTAVLSYGRLSMYGLYGDLLSDWEIGSDSKNILLPQNKTAYILGVSGITKMSLKY